MPRPFKLLSQARLATLKEAFSQVFMRWASDWLYAAETVANVQVFACDPTLTGWFARDDVRWFHASLDDLDVWFPLNRDNESRLLQHLVPSEEPTDDHPALDAVLNEMLGSLATGLLCEESRPPADKATEFDHEPPPDHVNSTGSGFAAARFAFGEAELTALLSGAVASPSSGAEKSSAAAAPLTPVRDAVDRCRLTGSVMLDLGSCAIEELQSLEPGDVITTQTLLNAAFELHLPDRGTVAAGRLGRRGESRALVLDC